MIIASGIVIAHGGEINQPRKVARDFRESAVVQVRVGCIHGTGSERGGHGGSRRRLSSAMDVKARIFGEIAARGSGESLDNNSDLTSQIADGAGQTRQPFGAG